MFILIADCYYRAFHRFGQAKFPDGGSVFGSSQFSILSQLPSKMLLDSKVVKINPKIIILLCWSKSVTHSVAFSIRSDTELQINFFLGRYDNYFERNSWQTWSPKDHMLVLPNRKPKKVFKTLLQNFQLKYFLILFVDFCSPRGNPLLYL